MPAITSYWGFCAAFFMSDFLTSITNLFETGRPHEGLRVNYSDRIRFTETGQNTTRKETIWLDHYTMVALNVGKNKTGFFEFSKGSFIGPNVFGTLGRSKTGLEVNLGFRANTIGDNLKVFWNFSKLGKPELLIEIVGREPEASIGRFGDVYNIRLKGKEVGDVLNTFSKEGKEAAKIKLLAHPAFRELARANGLEFAEDYTEKLFRGMRGNSTLKIIGNATLGWSKIFSKQFFALWGIPKLAEEFQHSEFLEKHPDLKKWLEPDSFIIQGLSECVAYAVADENRKAIGPINRLLRFAPSLGTFALIRGLKKYIFHPMIEKFSQTDLGESIKLNPDSTLSQIIEYAAAQFAFGFFKSYYSNPVVMGGIALTGAVAFFAGSFFGEKNTGSPATVPQPQRVTSYLSSWEGGVPWDSQNLVGAESPSVASEPPQVIPAPAPVIKQPTLSSSPQKIRIKKAEPEVVSPVVTEAPPTTPADDQTLIGLVSQKEKETVKDPTPAELSPPVPVEVAPVRKQKRSGF